MGVMNKGHYPHLKLARACSARVQAKSQEKQKFIP